MKKSDHSMHHTAPRWKPLAAAGLAAALTLSLTACGAQRDPAALLAEGWSNTSQMLAERYSGGPLNAIGSVLSQDRESTKVNLSVALQGLEGDLALYSGQDEQTALLLQANVLGEPLDAQIYYSPDFVGVGSQALLGDEMVYGAAPGRFSQEAAGSIFDPDTGILPIDAEVLQNLDETFQDLGSTLNGAGPQTDDRREEVDSLLASLAETYTDFLKSAKPTLSDGAVPSTGEKATVITYVYPGKQAMETLGSMVDTCLSSDLAAELYRAAGTAGRDLGGVDLDELREEWNALREDWKENYAGDVTVRCYLTGGMVSHLAVSAEPDYAGKKSALDVFVDFGAGGDLLKAELSLSGEAGTYQILFTAGQTTTGQKTEGAWTLESREDDVTAYSFAGGSSWDRESGALEASFRAGEGRQQNTLSVKGSLTTDAKTFELKLDEIKLGEQDVEEDLGLRLTLSLESDVAVPTPQKLRNLFQLTEDEAEQLTVDVLTNLYPFLIMLGD